MRGRAGIKAKRAYHEIDNNGLVQLARMTSESLRLCHACDTSSRTHQLIACDFCEGLNFIIFHICLFFIRIHFEPHLSPLYFHQDCLDPPLTNPPTAKWMCPAHPEKFFIANRELFQSQRKLVSDLFSSEGEYLFSEQFLCIIIFFFFSRPSVCYHEASPQKSTV